MVLAGRASGTAVHKSLRSKGPSWASIKVQYLTCTLDDISYCREYHHQLHAAAASQGSNMLFYVSALLHRTVVAVYKVRHSVLSLAQRNPRTVRVGSTNKLAAYDIEERERERE